MGYEIERNWKEHTDYYVHVDVSDYFTSFGKYSTLFICFLVWIVLLVLYVWSSQQQYHPTTTTTTTTRYKHYYYKKYRNLITFLGAIIMVIW